MNTDLFQNALRNASEYICGVLLFTFPDKEQKDR